MKNTLSSKLIRQLLKTSVLGMSALALGASAQTFKIGMTTDMSSAYSDLTGKGSAVAVQMAIDDFGGTILGKKIELLVADHQMKPSVGSSIITQWFDKEGVSVVVGWQAPPRPWRRRPLPKSAPIGHCCTPFH